MSPTAHVEVHTGTPSWHQKRAGAISAAVTVFATPEQADDYLTEFRTRHPDTPAFVIDRRLQSSDSESVRDSKGQA